MTLPPIDKQKLRRRRRKGPLERDIERAVSRYAKDRGIENEKYTSPNKRSVPDRIFYPGGGICTFIEFKALGCKPTEAQARDHARRRAAGYDVRVVDSIEEGRRVIDLWVALYGKN